MGGDLPAGKGGQHAGPLGLHRLQFRFLLLEIQRFHHHRLAGIASLRRNGHGSIPDEGLGLLLCLAIERQINPLGADQVAKPIGLGHGKVIRVDVDTDGTHLRP